MDQRLKLQALLQGLMGEHKVYYQPPATLTMSYPCIVYELGGSENRYADDIKYNRIRTYQVTVIDRNPDSTFPELVEQIPYTEMNSTFVQDSLNHFVFTLHF